MSCKCQQCKRNYKVDLLLPDWLWEKITPKPLISSAGMLCGSCIMNNIEALDNYEAIHVEIIDFKHDIPHCDCGRILLYGNEGYFCEGCGKRTQVWKND